MTLSNSISECMTAIESGKSVYAKNAIGDWIKVDIIRPDGSARVADHLSGFNDGTVFEMMTFENANIHLCIRDFEIQ